MNTRHTYSSALAHGASSAAGLVVLLATLLVPKPAGAQDARALTEGNDLERSGRYQEAAAKYRAVLRSDPANVGALLGLERVYTPRNQLDSLIAPLRAALARDPSNRPIRALELRLWLALNQPDSVAAAARRWIAVEPHSPEPYREWAYDLAQSGAVGQARGVLADGVARVGNEALGQDLAQLTALAGEWAEATERWLRVVRDNPSLLTTATGTLGRAPAPARDDVLRALLGAQTDSTSRLLAADLLVTWGRADEGWPLLDGSLPADPRLAASLLQRFADRAAGTRSRAGALVRGYALERLAGLVDAVAANRIRLQAAQAYAAGGDLGAAHRMLDQGGAASDSGAAAAPAMASLIRAMAAQGSVADAERQFRQWSDRLDGDDRERLRDAIAWAWVGQDELDRAEAALGADSGVAATAVRGWIALYRGDLATARARFRQAGPYAGTREEATQRTSTLVLLERVAVDRLPELGRAIRDLSRGDTARAVAGLAQAGRKLPASGGRAEVLELAGELALDRHDVAGAASLLGDALAADSTAPTAPAAELALADAYARSGRSAAATARLEHLILAYPQSAIVPQARRLLDRLRGAVPQ